MLSPLGRRGRGLAGERVGEAVVVTVSLGQLQEATGAAMDQHVLNQTN